MKGTVCMNEKKKSKRPEVQLTDVKVKNAMQCLCINFKNVELLWFYYRETFYHGLKMQYGRQRNLCVLICLDTNMRILNQRDLQYY